MSPFLQVINEKILNEIIPIVKYLNNRVIFLLLCVKINRKLLDMNKYMVLGGICSIFVALLHIAIIIGGPEWYRFFGAGETLAKLAEQGSWIPVLVTFGIIGILFIWGLYAFSGAGLIKKLPLLKLALVSISIIYIVRGVALFPVLIIEQEAVDSLLIWSSLASLIIGVAYAIGTKQVWSSI